MRKEAVRRLVQAKVVVAAALFLGCTVSSGVPKGATEPCRTPTSSIMCAVDGALARPEVVSGEFRREHRLVITVRYSSANVPESQITIGLSADDRLRVVIVDALGAPLHEQLQRGSAPKTYRREVSDPEPFRPLVETLLNMRPPLAPTHTLFVHPDVVTIWISTLAGETRFESSVKPVERDTAYWGDLEEMHPLLEWAAELRKIAKQTTSGDLR